MTTGASEEQEGYAQARPVGGCRLKRPTTPQPRVTGGQIPSGLGLGGKKPLTLVELRLPGGPWCPHSALCPGPSPCHMLTTHTLPSVCSPPASHCVLRHPLPHVLLSPCHQCSMVTRVHMCTYIHWGWLCYPPFSFTLTVPTDSVHVCPTLPRYARPPTYPHH